MKANQTHISLETAKLLKYCGIDSQYVYDNPGGIYIVLHKEENMPNRDFPPAYTWQEILWEYVDKFFGKKPDYGDGECDNHSALHTHKILNYLQQKKYEEADLYFRKNNIFTNKA